MKKSTLIALPTILVSLSAFAYANGEIRQSTTSSRTTTEPTGENTTYESRTIENIGTRPQVQYEQQDVQAQLQQAKRNVQIDEQNIKKAEEKKEADENQVKIDKATIKKYEAQKQEDEAILKKLEESLEDKKKKD